MIRTSCQECRNDSAVYDMNRHCCRVRYVRWLVPSVRRRVVDGIRARYGSGAAQDVVRELRDEYGIDIDGAG